jgi:hypothetical protein
MAARQGDRQVRHVRALVVLDVQAEGPKQVALLALRHAVQRYRQGGQLIE